MSWRKFLWLCLFVTNSALTAERGGGDDAGNGGFAYKQSIKILEKATRELEHKIVESDLKELNENPDWRRILSETLRYEALVKLPKKNQYLGRRKLAMNYQIDPEQVIILKPYYEAFMGKTDSELEDASLEVQKRLVHEASHIWGYKEKDSEAFSIRFMSETKPDDKRPTNAIDIKNFYACKNGKPDLIGSDSSICSQAPHSSSSILYLDTIMGPEIVLHSKLGNLDNWCNVQLDGDVTAPTCFLSATDGFSKLDNIPVSIERGSNRLTANIDVLSYDKTYIIKIYEGRTGTNAESKSFQVRRTRYAEIDPLGPLNVSLVSQYTCIKFFGKREPNGDVVKEGFVRNFYYYPEDETPSPMPPDPRGEPMTICHDIQKNPGNDSVEYPRLEVISGHFSTWSKNDPRFFQISGGKKYIDKLLEERLLTEYGVNANLDLFYMISLPNRPSQRMSPMGYILSPFNEKGISKCTGGPKDSDPLQVLLKEYFDSSVALYIAEDSETILENGMYKAHYSNMMIDQYFLFRNGFYIQNGTKFRVYNSSAMHGKTIYYYWPANDTLDPLIQNGRKIYTVKSPDELNSDVPIGLPVMLRTSDKRIGCIPWR